MGGTQIESNENLMTNGKPTFKTVTEPNYSPNK